ncbi:MAG: polysaccharide biosynthesis/export family protein [Bacteroidetes bacterium]|jgi:polysaccharide biosynthesis/export protein|nr:polysaccharide biosynthesis/export family protein [Bacteroidota bacterium]
MYASNSRPPQSIRTVRFAGIQFLAILFLAGLFFSGCTINRDIMFKTGDGYNFASLDDIGSSEYRIAPNDLITFQLFSNEGERLNQMTAGSTDGKGLQNQNMMNQRSQISYLVRQDGILELPEVGDMRLEGLTIEESEGLLEEAYSSFYNRPYVVVRVTNKRVLMFPGESGRAMVITLENMNTSLLEVMALAGGIGSRANASKVKLIRRTEEGNKIYQMDLSTVDGLSDAQLVVQANDIIYVEPLPQLARELGESLAPLTALLSTFTFLYAFIINSPN